jgi:16S rRNA (cytosine967-C5)-methyltransferase
MNVDPARDAVLAVAQRVEHGSRLSVEIDRQLSRRKLNGAQAATVTSLSYGVFRHLDVLDALLMPRLKRADLLPPEVLWALRIGAYERVYTTHPDHGVVNAWVDVIKGAHPKLAGLVNAVLKRLEIPQDPSTLDAEHQPKWLKRNLKRAYGQAADASLRDLLQASPFWCTTYGAGEAAMEKDGTAFEPGPIPRSYALRTKRPLAQTSAYARGLLQPQNPASLEVARIAAGRSGGGPVLDVCSGHGIKAAYLASLGLKVSSVELDASKIERAKKNQSRLGVAAEHIEADASQSLPLDTQWPTVLVDAPCSSTGTLRRHPEIKLRFDPSRLDASTTLQTRILTEASKHVVPGGSLIYAVCSFLHEEGPNVTETFLEAHPEFKAVPVDTNLPWSPASVGGFIQPRGGLDAFYIATLVRA